MESSLRKRKLCEIDKNIFFPNLFLDSKFSFKPSIKLPRNPLFKVNENSDHSVKEDGEDVKNDSLKSEIPRSECNVNSTKTRSCKKKCTKVSVQNGRTELNQILPVDLIQAKPTENLDLSSSSTASSETLKNESHVLFSDVYARELRLWFACIYIEDMIEYEFHKEKHFKLSESFCKKYDVNPNKRDILVGWLVSLQTHFKAGNCTLHLAVTLLDILLDKTYVPSEHLQVSAVAAFWVAYKFYHGNLSVKLLTGLCSAISSRDLILNYEILVLDASRLLQTGGDMIIFMNYLLYRLYGTSFPPEIYYSGQFFLDIMITQFTFVSYSACEKAITAVYASLSLFDPGLRNSLFEFNRYITKEKLRLTYHNLLRHLRLLYSDDKELRRSNLYRKYKTSRYSRISTHCFLLRLPTVATLDF